MFKHNEKIDDLFKKNTKIKDKDNLTIINKYLIHKNIRTKQINFSNDYKFDFYDITTKHAKNLKVRPESIFKLSIYKIIKRFNKYFANEIDFNLNFEKSNELEIFNENKNLKCCSIHDTYLTISKKIQMKKNTQ